MASDDLGFFNEISKYQEEEQVEGLTLYDIDRNPFAKVRLSSLLFVWLRPAVN